MLALNALRNLIKWDRESSGKDSNLYEFAVKVLFHKI
jgi:hypothetical protein